MLGSLLVGRYAFRIHEILTILSRRRRNFLLLRESCVDFVYFGAIRLLALSLFYLIFTLGKQKVAR